MISLNSVQSYRMQFKNLSSQFFEKFKLIILYFFRCHRPRDSLFSWSSNFENFTGLVNWGFLLLTMGGIRLLLENFIKYGIRIDPAQWIIALTGSDEGDGGHPSFILLLCKYF